MSAPGILYLVPTSLGGPDLDHVLPDAVFKVMAGIGYVIAENPKTARAFLKGVNTHAPLYLALQGIDIVRLDVSTDSKDLPALLAPLLAGRNAALVSEAGCPAIADPGAQLVRLAHQQGIRVKPLVGPSSILLALMASGLDGQRFAFNGYLPTEANARAKALENFEKHSRLGQCTQIFIETPYRNEALFDGCVKTLRADTLLCIATDITLESERIATMSISAWNKARPADLKNRPSIFLFLARS
jgi:16S rRNA (cytidine1402-2'-O)-methyltransferase